MAEPFSSRMISSRPGREGVGGTGLTIAAIRASETARPGHLFSDPLAAAFAEAGGLDPDGHRPAKHRPNRHRPNGHRRNTPGPARREPGRRRC